VTFREPREPSRLQYLRKSQHHIQGHDGIQTESVTDLVPLTIRCCASCGGVENEWSGVCRQRKVSWKMSVREPTSESKVMRESWLAMMSSDSLVSQVRCCWADINRAPFWSSATAGAPQRGSQAVCGLVQICDSLRNHSSSFGLSRATVARPVTHPWTGVISAVMCEWAVKGNMLRVFGDSPAGVGSVFFGLVYIYELEAVQYAPVDACLVFHGDAMGVSFIRYCHEVTDAGLYWVLLYH
jgi:hypothetical protein